MVSGAASTTDFPVLIDITSTDLEPPRVQTSGNDILFMDGTGSASRLDHEIESYDSGTGHLIAWVRLPSFSAGTTIYLYYGNTLAGNQQNPTGVWVTSTYAMVQHLSETGATQHDSTSNHNDGTKTGGVTQGVPGKIAGADDFPGTGSPEAYVSIPDSSSLNFGTNSFSYMFWVYSRWGTTHTQDLVGKKTGTATATDAGYKILLASGDAQACSVVLSDGTHNVRADTATCAARGANAWYLLTVVVDRTQQKMITYSNGDPFGTGNPYDISAIGTGSTTSTHTLDLGATHDTAGRMFNGLLDEVRVLKGALTADDVKTFYNSMNAPTSYLTVGTQESNSPVTTTTALNTISSPLTAGQADVGFLGSVSPTSVPDGVNVDLRYATSCDLGSGGTAAATVQTSGSNGGYSGTFTAPAAGSYQFWSYFVGNTGYGSSSSACQAIAVNPLIVTHTITASAGAHGLISPSGAVTVSDGGSQAFTMTPDANYHLSGLLVDGGSVTPASPYTFSGVTTDHTIVASFAIDTHTITASVSGDHGSISPSGAVSVNYGSDQSFTMTPDSGYHLSGLTVDSSPVTPASPYTFSSVTTDHTIVASFAINTYTITASAGSGGSISPSGSVGVNDGDTPTFTITPAIGYHIADVLVDGTSVGPVSSYQFAAVHENGHTIAATFAINTFTITASAGAHGSISPSGAVVVNYGVDQAFTIAADSGYHIADVLVDGGSVGAVSSYTFTNVQAAHTISATFAANAGVVITLTAISPQYYARGATVSYSGIVTIGGVPAPDGTVVGIIVKDYHDVTMVDQKRTTSGTGAFSGNFIVGSTGADGLWTLYAASGDGHNSETFYVGIYTIAASAGANGAISPSGAVSVNYGADQSFTITPAAHYHIADVLADGVSVGAVSSYTFTNVIAGHSIAASFAMTTHTITASVSGGHGSIDPSGAVSVNDGADQSFTMTADPGYHLSGLTVDSSPVTPVSPYTFSAVAIDRTIVASFSINVYTVTASAGDHGSIAPSGSVSVNYGTDQAFTITPSIGYHIADVLVDGGSVGAVSSYTFTNVQAGHTIAASFAIDTFTIAASAGAHGSISPSGAVSVNYGADQAFTITANTGYHIADVLVDGGSVGAVGSYTFTNVQAGHTIAASFAINVYTITASAGSGGSIEPSGAVSVNYGQTPTFTMTPDPGYHVLDVLVDGASVGGVSSYTFTAVQTDHTIAASFSMNTYTITVSAGSGGTISPPGPVTVNYGDSQTFTITPSPGYHIVDVVVDSVSQGVVTSYTFTNVQASHSIAATFSINVYTITATAGAHGSITPSGDVSVNYGTDQSFTIAPDDNYHVLDVSVDGSTVGAVGSYTFTNVQTTHTISASFLLNAPGVTVTGAYHGARLSWTSVGVASYDIYYNTATSPDTATQYKAGVTGTGYDVTDLPSTTWDKTCYFWVAPGSDKASWGSGSDKVWTFKIEITSVTVVKHTAGDVQILVQYKSRYLGSEGINVGIQIGEYLGPGTPGSVPSRPVSIVTTEPITLSHFMDTGSINFESSGEFVSGQSYKAWVFLWNQLPSESGYWEPYADKYEVGTITIT